MKHKVCLIVDNKSVNGKVIGSIARSLEFQTVNVSSADDALSFITSGVADVVFLDWHMDNTDIKELMKNIRNNVQGQVVPIIIATEDPQEKLRHEAYDIDADAVIHKPISIDQIATLFDKLSVF